MNTFIKVTTTNRPPNPKAAINDVSSWPPIVHIAWRMTHKDGLLFRDFEFTVKPDSNEFAIDPKWPVNYGATLEDCVTSGTPLDEILDQLCASLDVSHLVIGHNIDFIRPVIVCEMLRRKKAPKERAYKFLCTMANTVTLCNIPAPNGVGNKFPSLPELYFALFGKEPQKPMKALHDVLILESCYWELQKRMIKLHTS
jgi:hypothetical protein